MIGFFCLVAVARFCYYMAYVCDTYIFNIIYMYMSIFDINILYCWNPIFGNSFNFCISFQL